MVENHWTETLLNSSVVNTTGTSGATNVSIIALNDIPTSSSNKSFSLTFHAWTGLAMGRFNSLFEGSIWGNNGGEATYTPMTMAPLYNEDTNINGTKQIVPANIADVMANVARSMTKNLREYADPTDNMVVGQSLDVQTFLYVRWAWIALPAALHALTLGLLLITVILTARGRVPVWKTSVYPLLRARVEGAPGGKLQVAFRLHEMEEAVENEKMKLTNDPRKAAFVS